MCFYWSELFRSRIVFFRRTKLNLCSNFNTTTEVSIRSYSDTIEALHNCNHSIVVQRLFFSLYSINTNIITYIFRDGMREERTAGTEGREDCLQSRQR